MKTPGLLLFLIIWAMPALAQDIAASPEVTASPTAVPSKAKVRVPTKAAAQPTSAQQGDVLSDVAGGRVIPKPIVDILADPRIDPIIAYILWQLSRKTMDEWTLSELGFVGQAAPTLAEAGITVGQLQTLYKFWGLDPDDVFNPSLPANWQSRSTAFDPRSAAAVAAISSAECQVDISQMTVATFRSCSGGGY
jgi:hypothetical protein